jgi:hypothetical protein
MSTLTLTATTVGRNDKHARISVFQNGALAGILTVDVEHEGNVIVAIQNGANALHDMVEAANLILGLIDVLDEYDLPYTDEELEQLAATTSGLGEIGPADAAREIRRRAAIRKAESGDKENP